MQLSPFHDDYVKTVIARFEAANPTIFVKWVDIPWSEMERKTLTAVAAKAPPDVVNLNPQFAAKLAEFNALANPEAYLSKAEIAAYLPSAYRANQLDGKSFGLPWYLNTNVLLYNREILDRAELAVPATHDQLLTVARGLRTRLGSYAYFPALDGSSPLETLVAMGGELVTADGCRAGFINAAGERILSHYQALYQEQLVPRNVVTEGHRKAVEMFLSGQVAMVTTGMQFMQTIKHNNPSMYAKIGIAPQLGVAMANSATPPNIAAMNIAVLSASTKKTSAFKFAQFVTNAESQLALAKRVPILPSTAASYEDEFFSIPQGDTQLERARQLSIEQVKVGRVLVPPIRNYNKLKVSYARNLQAVMLGKKSVAVALRDLDTEWQSLLNCRARGPAGSMR